MEQLRERIEKTLRKKLPDSEDEFITDLMTRGLPEIAKVLLELRDHSYSVEAGKSVLGEKIRMRMKPGIEWDPEYESMSSAYNSKVRGIVDRWLASEEVEDEIETRFPVLLQLIREYEFEIDTIGETGCFEWRGIRPMGSTSLVVEAWESDPKLDWDVIIKEIHGVQDVGTSWFTEEDEAISKLREYRERLGITD